MGAIFLLAHLCLLKPKNWLPTSFRKSVCKYMTKLDVGYKQKESQNNESCRTVNMNVNEMKVPKGLVEHTRKFNCLKLENYSEN